MTSIDKPALARSLSKAAPPITAISSLLILAMLLSGCGSQTPKTTTSSTQPIPQIYMSPLLFGNNLPSPGYSVSAYTFDDTAETFSDSTYYFGAVEGGLQEGIRTYYSGITNSIARGLLSLGLGYSWSPSSPTLYNPPQTGSWGFELPSQAGGLIDINGQSLAPLVPATSCPNFTTPQTYWFLTLPAPFPSSPPQPFTWDPTQETVFGSVDVGGSGSSVTFSNIQQFALPSFPTVTPGPPATTVTSPQSGTCSSTYYGNTTAVPANLSVTNPGPNSAAPPVALVGIGPTGLLVESNAANGEASAPPYFQDLLGAGTGAIGLPKPSSAVSTSTLVGAQYLGFFYGTGSYGGNSFNGMGPSTLVASFGFAASPVGCNTVAAQTATMIYGGDFAGNNPGSPGAQANGGFPQCDMAIDLGVEDPNNNGLYPAATVYVGAFYEGNQTAANYSFPAVAIAGQLGDKYAIFLTGIDITGIPNQAWGIYLLQSN
jgi:hypothetical protein